MADETTATRFRFLVCIDGTEDSYRGVHYAAEYGPEHDICLCYVRPMDRGLRSGGLNVRVARENMMTWGHELPGIKYLKKGRDILIELGAMGPDWEEQATHVDVEGDPLGDNKIEYIAKSGKRIILKLKVAFNIPDGIIEQTEVAPYDLIIVGASERWRKRKTMSFWDPAVAEKVVDHAPCPVLVARHLDAEHGHLLCTDGSEHANEALRKNLFLVTHGNAPVSIMTVAADVEGEEEATANLKALHDMLTEKNITVKDSYIRIGDPAEHIAETGENYSVIVVSETAKSPWHRFFKGSVSTDVLQKSNTSVMVVR